MSAEISWKHDDAVADIQQVLDAAKRQGAQKIVDADGVFEVVYKPRKQSLQKLLSKPGPLEDGD